VSWNVLEQQYMIDRPNQYQNDMTKALYWQATRSY